MSQSSVEVTGLSFGYERGVNVLESVSFAIKEGEKVAIVGDNGAGKSTLLRILLGLEMGFTGQVRIMDIPLEKGTLPRIREREGYVFQDSDSQLFMPTVGEDVAFGPMNFGLNKEEVEKRVVDALKRTGILSLRNRPVHKLSGGEKKLAAIATILSMSPDIICMDEPTASLDKKNRERLMDILSSFHRTLIIATHDLELVEGVCSRVITLKDGVISS